MTSAYRFLQHWLKLVVGPNENPWKDIFTNQGKHGKSILKISNYKPMNKVVSQAKYVKNLHKSFPFPFLLKMWDISSEFQLPYVLKYNFDLEVRKRLASN